MLGLTRCRQPAQVAKSATGGSGLQALPGRLLRPREARSSSGPVSSTASVDCRLCSFFLVNPGRDCSSSWHFQRSPLGFVLFLWYWGLAPSLPHARHMHTPPLSCTASPFYSEAGSREAAQAGLDFGMLLSWPPESLGSQGRAIASTFCVPWRWSLRL